MGRPPIGKSAMSPAERQQRRRKLNALAEKQKIEPVDPNPKRRRRPDYLPMPAGLVFWEPVKVVAVDGSHITAKMPIRRPLAEVDGTLTDDDLLYLVGKLSAQAIQRGLVSRATTAREMAVKAGAVVDRRTDEAIAAHRAGDGSASSTFGADFPIPSEGDGGTATHGMRTLMRVIAAHGAV